MTFRLLAFGCSHENRDIASGREALALAISQANSPAFGGWDMGISLGDHNGSGMPSDKTGRETSRQFVSGGAASRGKIYTARGNHDQDGPGYPDGLWYERYVDPLGQNRVYSGLNPATRPHPVTGTWDKQKIVGPGNLVFLIINPLARPDFNLRGLGGDPGGWIPQETFDWWKAECESYRNGPEIVITCCHYAPKDTVIATGDYEGGTIDANGVYQTVYHGLGFNPKWSGCLCCIGEAEGSLAFTDHLAQHNSDTAMWLSAHTHAPNGSQVNGRLLRMEINGCHFINCAAVTKYHGNSSLQQPRFRLIEFTDGSADVVMRNWYMDANDGAGGYLNNPVTMTLPKVVQL